MFDSFAVFILTHGRPHKVTTYNTLRRCGYTGDIYLIIDNEDKTAAEYRKHYGDKVIEFNKAAIAQTFDECDNFHIPRKSVVYARNACFGIARELGIDYFLQLDDDYSFFGYTFDHELRYKQTLTHRLDEMFKIVLDYYKSIPALTIAIAQSGDLVGGQFSTTAEKLWLKRKAMNSFFCSIDRPFQFTGRINEDVNTYVTLGNRGHLIFTVLNARLTQKSTQENSGGMTELYIDNGTYLRSFYTVMQSPSCVKIHTVGYLHSRIHHLIDWKSATPVIISERWQKINNDN